MKNSNNIFNRFLFCVRAVILACVVVLPGGAVADDECMDEDNDAIAAEFALCSTHAYNIGQVENPHASERKLMNDVIGLKTTFITQQMYLQYEQMESMLNRFKTQLEKAVLRAKLQAAGAGKDNDNDDDDYYATGRVKNNQYITGASNCGSIRDMQERAECYDENYKLINSLFTASKSGVPKEVQQQLKVDYMALCDEEGLKVKNSDKLIKKPGCDNTKDKDGKYTDQDYAKCVTVGGGKSALGNTKTFQECLVKHNANINTFYTAATNSKKPNNAYIYPPYGQ